mmetsp:Transcript_12241/g.18961  ORF Transcript_12241/g.18961 Transcript_12241/m.18961 type:complete len:130 (+) Transcript_12241:668-1057(+)
MSNAIDFILSEDGQNLALTSPYGTLSLWSKNTNCKSNYERTRIQQFFEFDSERGTTNHFENLEAQPKICNFSMTPYEAQPGRPIIGKFRNHPEWTEVKADEYQRTMNRLKVFSIEEEEYYEEQLHSAIN